ncbi:Sporulation related domain [Brevundimonas vesicularis]|uniref:Sporulation related domain n=1 Tax=Brevundimonas vesicularis TaxID=41276 RepID=A0A2X1B8T6_BREVE|nr:SPOR domain-containing protein [Brevundimonas vesicularis]SPU52419.1 Sporulation related domain [Brevundimonas vesicularis]
MTPAEATRPVLIALAFASSLAVAGCGAVDSDPHRFSTMAENVAAIDIPLSAGHRETRHAVAEKAGLRPVRFTPVKVAVMDPHAMWDARDVQAGLRPVGEDTGLRDAVVRAASPAVVKAVADEAVSRVQAPVLRPARLPTTETGRTIQLGAYSSPAGARQAWDRVKATSDLSGLSPIYQEVEVGGRRLTRLKVGPVSNETAAAVCRSAAVADAWCARNS